jgi:hypothetical protein
MLSLLTFLQPDISFKMAANLAAQNTFSLKWGQSSSSMPAQIFLQDLLIVTGLTIFHA